MTSDGRQCYPGDMDEPHPVSEARNPAAEVEALVANSGSSFLAAMWFLPAEKRRGMYAVYSFCRAVDDIADGDDEPEHKRRQLAIWREEIANVFAGRPVTAVGMALAPLIGGYGLRQDDFLAVIDGMEFDSTPSVRIADDADLDLYCERVACAVGRLSNPIFGLKPEQGDPLADALGRALQVTNILRDLNEDAERDRLYIPVEMIVRHGLSADGDAFTVLGRPGFSGVCRELAERNIGYYAKARALLAGCDRKAARPARIMMEVYRRILDRLVVRGWEQPALSRPVRVSKLEKLWIACRYGVF